MAGAKYKGKQVTSVCKCCGLEFTYLHETGMRRRHCSPACRVALKKTKREAERAALATCGVSGCGNKANRKGAGMCEMHYIRVRRTGNTQERMVVGRYLRGSYVLLLDRSHPLATSHGTVAEHRAVAYEKYGGVCQPCHWCAAPVTWKTCHVDHLNGNKQDNRANNLVISCARCNRSRGAVQPFLVAMTASAFEQFVAMARADREATVARHAA